MRIQIPVDHNRVQSLSSNYKTFTAGWRAGLSPLPPARIDTHLILFTARVHLLFSTKIYTINKNIKYMNLFPKG